MGKSYLIAEFRYSGKERAREEDRKLLMENLEGLVSSKPNIYKGFYQSVEDPHEFWIEVEGNAGDLYDKTLEALRKNKVCVSMYKRELKEVGISGKSKHSQFYNYADFLYDRGILHTKAKVVEGCVGNTGWESSLEVAKYLGQGGKYYMVDFDPIVSFHKKMFLDFYKPDFFEGEPKLDWVIGPIENQGKLISGCDALLFHNYVPIDKETYEGKNGNAYKRIKNLFDKLVKAKPKHIAFWSPPIGDKLEVAIRLFQDSGMKFEIVDDIHYAGQLDENEREKWKGKIILTKISS